jgi:Tol biopolymer transport system component
MWTRVAVVCSIGLVLTVSASACSGSTTGQAAASASAQVRAAAGSAAASTTLIAYSEFTDASLRSSVIKVSRFDGSGQRQLTGAGASVKDTRPSWSPDGRKLAFEREQPRAGCGAGCVTREIYVVNVADRRLTQLTHSPAAAGCGAGAHVSCHADPSWSPDGIHIAYAAAETAKGRSGIWVTDLAGAADQVSTSPAAAVDAGPAWSPDSKSLAFSQENAGGGSIFTISATGQNVRQLTPSDADFRSEPAWSPDGTRIMFRKGSDLSEQTFHPAQLFTVRDDGTGLERLTPASADIEYLSASWSPDGSQIIAARVQRGRDNGRARLALLNGAGGFGRFVVADANWQTDPRWSPGA